MGSCPPLLSSSQGLDFSAAKIHSQSAPENAGTEHLARLMQRFDEFAHGCAPGSNFLNFACVWPRLIGSELERVWGMRVCGLKGRRWPNVWGLCPVCHVTRAQYASQSEARRIS